MIVATIFQFSLAAILLTQRHGVYAEIVPELLWWGRTYSGDFDDLARLPQYASVMIGGGPISIGFKATWDAVVNNGHILGFDDGQGNNGIEVYNDGSGSMIYKTSREVRIPPFLYTLHPGFEHAFLITGDAAGTFRIHYQKQETVLMTTTPDTSLLPASVVRFRMNIGAAADGTGTFRGDIHYVAIWNEVVTWEDMMLATATTTTNTTSTTTTTTTTTRVDLELRIQTSSEPHADTQSGASVSFEVGNSWTQPQTFCTHAAYEEVISQSFELKAWPKSLLVTARPSALVQDSWGLRQISIILKRSGVEFVVLAPGNLSYALNSKYWIDVHAAQALGAHVYPIPEFGCTALVGIAQAPSTTCVQGGFIQHDHDCMTRCFPGYVPSASLLLCTDGAFSPASYTCTPMACGRPTAPTNGLLGGCSAPLASGDSCAPQCKDGYLLHGETTCLLGTLTHAVCLGKPCNVTHLPPHARRGTCPMALQSGDSCQLKCENGYYGGATSCYQGISSVTHCLLNLTIEIETATDPFSETADGAIVDFMFSDGWSNEEVMCENAAKGEIVTKAFDGLPDWPMLVRLKGRGMDYWKFRDRHIWILFQGHKKSLRVTQKTAMYPIISIGSGSDADTYPAAQFEVPALFCEAPSGITSSSSTTCAEGHVIDYGAQCTSQCDVGYVPTVPSLSCGLEELTPQSFACLEKSCEMTTAPLNGSIGNCVSRLASGTSCSFACHDGYTLSGPSVCNLGNLSQAVCEPSSCHVTLPAHSLQGDCPLALAHENSCELGCEEGYAVHRNVSCKFGNLTFGACFPKSCSYLNPPEHGSRGNCSEVLESNTSCQPECDHGYHVSGNTSCHLGSLTPASCLASPCAMPMLIANGRLGNCPNLMNSSSECYLECDLGYHLWSANSGKTTCSLGKLDLGRCMPDPCNVSLPMHAEHGKCPQLLQSGESCMPVCRRGYYSNGTDILISCSVGVLISTDCVPSPCDASNAPVHGSQGNCTAFLSSGMSCQPICLNGHLVSGPTSCFEGRLTEASCIPMPCDFQLPDNSTRGDCPDVLQPGSTCQPNCTLGYDASGPTTCNGGHLQRTSCIARSCVIAELPENSVGYGDCHSILESGSTCRPRCAAGFIVGSEFRCGRGTLQLASCIMKENATQPESDKTFAEKALPYAIAGSSALFVLFLIVIGSLCWCSRKQSSKYHSDIERQDGLIEQLRRGIDELNRRTILSEQERRELRQLRMPALPPIDSVDGEEMPRGVRTLTFASHMEAPAASVFEASSGAPRASVLGNNGSVLHTDDIRVDIVDEVRDEPSIVATGCMSSWPPLSL